MGNEGTAYSQNGSTIEINRIGKAEGHTQYAQHAKRRKLAIEKIVNHRRFLFKEDLEQAALEQKILSDITPYLVSEIDTTQSPLQEQINALKNDPNKDAVSQLKIDEKIAQLSEYKNNYLTGVTTYQQSDADMQTLDDNNAVFSDDNNTVFSKVFLPPPEKQHEYRYIIDNETCKYLCQEHNLDEDATLSFSLSNTIELKDNQTDAVRVWRNKIHVKNLTIRDNRDDIKSAHRDGIQLIPPPKYRKTTINGKDTLVKQADQMVGTILEDVTIFRCDILAPNAALQGIFSSDGMCKNLKINDVSVGTRGGHAIAISGVLSGCDISHVTLHQQAGGQEPEIALYPFRIGGNMADDGMVYILGFKQGSGFNYDPITQSSNKCYLTGQSQPKNITVSDYRGKIPDKFVRFTLGLKNFDYPSYFHDYTEWTLADFKREMHTEYQQMKAWVNRRYKEYSRGTRDTEADQINGKSFALPDISTEQKNPKKFGVLDMLYQAQQLLATEDSTRMNTRLPELQETAIRSFTMKCIAIKHGEPEKLYHLGRTLNIHRKAYLHYLMPASYFADENLETTNNPYLHLFAQSNDSPTTQSPENGKPPKTGDAYSNDTDRELAKAVRIAPDISIPQGKPIAFYFDFNDGSKYKQGGYTFKWLVSNNPKFIPKEGNDAFYSLSSSESKNIALGDNRVYCYVSKNGKTSTVIIRFKVTEAEESTTAETLVKSIKLDTSNAYAKNAESLRNALRISPSLSVEQGKSIRFYFAKDSHYNSAEYSVVWTTPELKHIPISREKHFELDTTGFEVGKKSRRIFCDVTKKGSAMERVIITGLEILAKGTVKTASTSEATAETATNTIPTVSVSEFTAHQASIIKDKDIITAGDIVTFRFDANYEGARYYWAFDGNGITPQTGSTSNLMVDTTGFSPGKYRLRGTVTSKDRKQHQVSMWVDVEESNWIGIELDTSVNMALYQDVKYELVLPNGDLITGVIKDQQSFRINVPADVEQAEFRWVD